jgi:NADPH:quinone reductase
MKALYLTHNFDETDKIFLPATERPKPSVAMGHCLVKVHASGINPSDALSTLGYFKQAKLPRIPGRDFAGVVVEGEKSCIGKSVWGSGGAAGLGFDGAHAEYMIIPTTALAEIPSNMNLITAGAQPLPYITAYYSLVSRAHIQKDETVLITGALGQVGKAAMSICQWQHCKPIAIVRGNDGVQQAKALGWVAIDSTSKHLAEDILNANAGKPINVVFNSLGNLLWADFMRVLSEFGRIVTISAREGMREVTINLLELYRANLTLIGINTVALNFTQNANLLNEMKSGFELGALQPLEVEDSMTFTLENASEGYKTVIKGSEGKRVVIRFG